MHYRIPLAAACATICAGTALALPAYGDFAAPVNAEKVPGAASSLNTTSVDGCVSLSRNGTELYFNSNRAGSQDIYVATRTDTSEPFGPPQALPATINTPATEFCPTSIQGNFLYFSRSRSDDAGDIFVSRKGPRGWSEPESLGPSVNSSLMDEAVDFFADHTGRTVMVWSRRQANGAGGQVLQMVEGGTATLVPGGPNQGGSNNRPTVTHDGLTMFFDSTRPGGLGGPDLYVASRASTMQAFGPAVALAELNAPGFDARPSMSWNGEELYFSSDRTGSESPAPDIWMTRRAKTRGPKSVTF